MTSSAVPVAAAADDDNDESAATFAPTGSTPVEELLPALKEELLGLGGGNNSAATTTITVEGAKDYNLLKFLRWKSDVGRAADRYRGLQQWRIRNTFAFDDPPLLASQDPSLRRVLESEVIVAPDGMVDKRGRTVLVGRFRNNDMRDGRTPKDVARMALYTLDRILEQESTQTHGVVVFHDLVGLSPHNLDPRIPKIIFAALVGHLPIRVHAIYLYRPPAFFRAAISVLSYIMPAKLRQRTHFVNSLEEVYEVIDQDEMLEEHGGKRVHDAKAWVARHMEREVNGTIQSLRDCTTTSF